MSMEAVLEGSSNYHLEAGDCTNFLRKIPAAAASLVFGSPPYEDARLYDGQGNCLVGEAWVKWMYSVYEDSYKCCNGLVGFVVEGRTKNFSYSCTPYMLLADLKRAGYTVRKPPIYRRVGIPGKNADWLRNDYEPVICISHPGKLPYSNPLACGSPPKFPPGGKPSHRKRDGSRVNQEPEKAREYKQPAITNPGNVVQESYTFTAKELGELLEGKGFESGEIIDSHGGGGHMGSKYAHMNEAPFSYKIAEFMVKTFSAPGGIVVDPFVGSGTVMEAAIRNGRRFMGCDLRDSQIKVCKDRINDVLSAMRQ